MTPSVSRGANNACNHWINGGVDDCKCDTEGVTVLSSPPRSFPYPLRGPSG